MELLPHQRAYSGPPARYSVHDTVYHQGQPYTVTAVRRGIGQWLYELDGPAELLRVGEGEILDALDHAALDAARALGTSFAAMRRAVDAFIAFDEVMRRTERTAAQDLADLLALHVAANVPSPPPQNRAARRAKHRPWSPPR